MRRSVTVGNLSENLENVRMDMILEMWRAKYPGHTVRLKNVEKGYCNDAYCHGCKTVKVFICDCGKEWRVHEWQLGFRGPSELELQHLKELNGLGRPTTLP